MSFTTIKNAIITQVEAVTEIDSVSGFEVENPLGTPFATVTLESTDVDFDTTQANQIILSFRVMVYDQLGGKAGDKIEVEERIEGIVQSIIENLSKLNIQLTDERAWQLIPRVHSMKYVKQESGDMRACEMIVEVWYKVDSKN